MLKKNIVYASNSTRAIVAADPKWNACLQELYRMASAAEQAFYQAGENSDYTCMDVKVDLTQHFKLAGEYRYYLWMANTPDSYTKLPFAALYAVNIYGTIDAHRCYYSHRAIASAYKTFVI